MITSALLTTLFVVTGGWAAVRLAQAVTRRGPAADVVAELAHLAMSLAMIAMAWGVVAGPADVGGTATLLVFGLVAAWALVRLARPAGRLRWAVTGQHLLMATAMIWMVAAMPRLVRGGDAASAAPRDAMPGTPGMAGMPGMAGTDAPGWVTASTWLLVPALGLAAGLWVLRGLRAGSAAPTAPDDAAAVAGPGAVAVLASPSAPARVTAPAVCRLDACCHALMSAGMAAMILAMV